MILPSAVVWSPCAFQFDWSTGCCFFPALRKRPRGREPIRNQNFSVTHTLWLKLQKPVWLRPKRRLPRDKIKKKNKKVSTEALLNIFKSRLPGDSCHKQKALYLPLFIIPSSLGSDCSLTQRNTKWWMEWKSTGRAQAKQFGVLFPFFVILHSLKSVYYSFFDRQTQDVSSSLASRVYNQLVVTLQLLI